MAVFAPGKSRRTTAYDELPARSRPKLVSLGQECPTYGSARRMATLGRLRPGKEQADNRIR